MKKKIEKQYIIYIKLSTPKITDDPNIDQILKREILGYKNQLFSMRFWFFFYFSGLMYVFKVGNLNIMGKIALFSFFFIPNYYRYRKIFKDQKKKIFNTLIELDLDKIKNHSNEIQVIQLMNEFDLYLNNNL